MKWDKIYIAETNYRETVLQVKLNELPVLRRAVQEAVKKLQPQYDKVKDKHESGEATERQCTRMQALGDELDELKNFLDYTK